MVKSGNAITIKLSKEKWEKRVQSAAEKGEKEIGASSTITVSRECPQKSVESPVHQQDKYGGAGCGQGGVKGLCNLYWWMWDCEVREELSNENIISKEDEGLGEGGVIMVECGIDDPLVENRICEHIDEEDFPLGSGEMEEVEGNVIGRYSEDREHDKSEGSMHRWNALYPLPAGVTQAVIGLLPHVLPIWGSILQFPGDKGLPLPGY